MAPRNVLVVLPFPNPSMDKDTKDKDTKDTDFNTTNDAFELSPTIRATTLLLLLFMDNNTCVVLRLQVDAHEDNNGVSTVLSTTVPYVAP